MPIVTADILFKLSIRDGIAGNTLFQPEVDRSLGGFISKTLIANLMLNNLFHSISALDNAGKLTNYRSIFVQNSHSSATLVNPRLWLSVPSRKTSLSIGVDGTGVASIGAGTQAVSIEQEGIAPAGVSFSSPIQRSGALRLPDLPPGHCVAIWVRRQPQNTGRVLSDKCVLMISGDS